MFFKNTNNESSNHLNQKWLLYYNELRKDLNYLVEIYELNEISQFLSMEKIDGVTVRDKIDELSDTQINEVVLFLINAIFDFERTKIFNRLYGHHLDLALDNIMINEEKRLIIIDPNSFQFQTNFNYGKSLQLLEALELTLLETDIVKKRSLLNEYDKLMDIKVNSSNLENINIERFMTIKNRLKNEL
jgi:tRNA A-37 threonylcarbamoyl transferase component Bud32